MATALPSTINNNPAHQRAVAQRSEEVRSKNAAMLVTGFWGGIILGLVATLGLFGTYFLGYS